jgi:CheY-like chemotaxis protein
MRNAFILIAEDEPVVRDYIGKILRKEGFRLLEAIDGIDALEQLDKSRDQVDLLVTDIRMPRMDGISLAHSIEERYPRTPVIYMSGYPFDLREERIRHPTLPCAFLAKPFSRVDLVDAVRKCLERPGSAPGR